MAFLFRIIERKHRLAWLPLIAAGATLLAAPATQALPPPGSLSQLSGTAGCVSIYFGACEIGAALSKASSVATSPDGKYVYVASSTSNAVSIFSRDVVTGALHQLSDTNGCVSENGTDGDDGEAVCAVGRGLEGATSVALSPDGANLYVASNDPSGSANDGIAIFGRQPDGTLTQSSSATGCIKEVGDNNSCADGKGLDGASSVTISPDGKNGYATSSATGSNGDAVAIFTRNNDGSLTQLSGTAGCIWNGSAGTCAHGNGLDGASSVTVSPDNKNVYVASIVSDAVALFTRNTDGSLTQLSGTAGCIWNGATGTCLHGDALDGARSVALSASDSGKNVYVASNVSDAVASFTRNNDGSLTQLSGTAGCIWNGSAGICAHGNGLDGADAVTVSPDGKNVYATSSVAGTTNDAVIILARDLASGALTQAAGIDGCLWNGTAGSCNHANALDGATSVIVTPDGNNAYVASSVSNAVVAFFRRGNNHAPICNSASPVTPYTTALLVTLSCTDMENDTLSYSIVANPANGTLSQFNASKGTVIYTPNAGFSGNDMFTFNSSDSELTSNTASVTVTVQPRPPDKPPTCSNVYQVVPYNTATSIALSCSDPFGDPLTYSTVSDPTHGTLGAIDQATGAVAYTPSSDYSGSDTFQYKVSAGGAESTVATVDITVQTPPPDAPVCEDIPDFYVPPNTIGFLALKCTNPTGGQLKFSVVEPPMHGSLGSMGAFGNVNYTPDPDFQGTDSFTYKASDGLNTSGVATVKLTISSTRLHQPACTSESQAVSADAPSAITLECTDRDGDPLSRAVVSAPSHGALGPVGTDGTVMYTPEPGFLGADSFTFDATDPSLLTSNTATISLTVVPGAAQQASTSSPFSPVGPSGDRSSGERRRIVIARPHNGVKVSRQGVAELRLFCDAASGDRCSGALTLKTLKRIKSGNGHSRRITLGKRSLSIPGGSTANVKVHLSKTGESLLGKLHKLGVEAVARFRNQAGDPIASRRVITLRAV